MSEVIGNITEALQSGIYPDLKGRSAPLWIDGRNLYFEDKALRGGLGQFLLFNPSEQSEVLGITSTYLGGLPTIFYGTAAKLWRWDETNGLEDVTNTGGAYTGGTNDLWDFAAWGEWMIATNGVDTPQVYKTGDFADVGGLGTITTIDAVVEWSPYMLGFATNLGEKEVAWSDTDDVEDWVATSTNAAGALEARGLNSAILSGKKVGDNICFASTDELRVVNYIREPFIFGIEPAIRGFGITGKHAFVTVGDIAYGFGPRGIWASDLIKAEYITHGILQDFIYNNINRDKWHKVVAFHDRVQSLVGFYYPTENSDMNDRGVALNYRNNSWTIFNYGRSAAADVSVFDFAITGDTEGNLYFSSATGAPTPTGEDATLEINEGGTLTQGWGIGGWSENGWSGETAI